MNMMFHLVKVSRMAKGIQRVDEMVLMRIFMNVRVVRG